MYATGIDPGPTRTSVSTIEMDAAGRFSWIEGRHVELGGGYAVEGLLVPHMGEYLDRVLDEATSIESLVALEYLVGYAYEAKRVQALIETSRIEGMIIARAIQREITLDAIPAKAWRGTLCRTESPSNEQIRIVVEGIVRGIPHLRYDEREHIYDAAGVAIVKLLRATRQTLRLPAAVQMALLHQQAVDRAKRARKRADKAPPEKRSPTRAQTQRRSAAQFARFRS